MAAKLIMNSGEGREIFQWSAGFNVGLGEVDDQHAKLVELLNRLAQYHTSATFEGDVLTVFDELLAYTAYHFATEDKLMRDYAEDRAHVDTHRQAHREFIDMATAARTEAEASPNDATGNTIVFLTNWLIHHILGMDRRLAMEIRRTQKRRNVPVTVGAIPRAEHTIDMLISAIDNLYDRLGQNAAELRESNQRLANELAKSRLAEAELRIAATAFEVQEGILIADAQARILRVNRAFCEITGYTAEEVIGRNPRMFSSGHQSGDFYAAMWRSINMTGNWRGELWNRRKSGESYPAWLSITAVHDDEGKPTHFVGTTTDIAPRKQAEDRIRNLAYFDQLTQLPNRRLMLDRLDQSLSARTRNDRHGAILMLDLDDFKSLNDSMGHGVGDNLLIEVARRLKSCVRDDDTVARLGGDDFVVIIGDLGAGGQAPVQAELVATKILEALAQPYQLDIVEDGVVQGTCQHTTTSSIGIAMFHDRKVSAEDLVTRAETAMYLAKKSGRQSHRFFEEDMQQLVIRRASLERDLRVAIGERLFELYYQPQVDARGIVVGAEALVRWNHPERGMIEPGEFIPLAEETGLIVPLGHWVIEEACRCLSIWARSDGLTDLTLAVNVSAKHFSRPTFTDEVLALIEHYGITPGRLKLELTESHFLENPKVVIQRMAQLKAHKVSFSMDDFGTGYSSLAYLKQLPLDQLKIDQSFVRDILSHANDAAIAKTIVSLAQSLGLSVIAEGVETEGQRRFLLEHGCPTCQGYLFSRPVPLKEFEAFVARQADCAENRRRQLRATAGKPLEGLSKDEATAAPAGNLGNILLFFVEIFAISLLNYLFTTTSQFGGPIHISLDVLYCLPIIQVARMASIGDLIGHSDSNIATYFGIFISIAWSATELAIVWPDFPLASALLNVFTRSIVLTLLGRMVLKLWRSSASAKRDPLTNLANRRGLLERLESERIRSARSGKPFSLLYIDMDNLKALNDQHGHAAGDEGLKLIANILRSCSRESDVPARLGGDEFLLLLPNTASQYCEILINRIMAATTDCVLDCGWPISVSVGHVTSLGRDREVESLMQAADRSMYEAKQSKRMAVA